MSLPAQDAIYAVPHKSVKGFRFDETVVRVFPDMIKRSVPGYDNIVPMIGLIAARYTQPDSVIYDLGCSLGAVTVAILEQVQEQGTSIVAVDNSAAMVDKLRQLLESQPKSLPVDLRREDVLATEIVNASVVVLNFTLQFIPVAERDRLLRRIHDGLRPGGILILSEKIRLADPEQDEYFIDLHHDFKRANGYSDLEIAQKRTALENVLIPETITTHQARAAAAGFERCDVWFQAFNFISMIAIKE